MRNNIFYNFFFIFIFLSFNLASEELEINSSQIKYDSVNKITIFEGSVNSKDVAGNKLFSEFAKYNKVDELYETQGATKIITSEGFTVLGSDIVLDNKNKLIYSNNDTEIIDKDGNKILVKMFNYSILTSVFFSQGDIKIIDVHNNNYNFSEIYIDEKKKKIVGSDVKAFLKQDGISSDKNNEPRFFANTMSLSDDINTFEKGIFTYCKNRNNNKCPPWVLQSKKIKHDLAKKTIFYENVVLKIYDFPIFFAPKFSHPDPTVKRRSGFLAPSLSNSGTLGSGFSTPYFLDMGKNKDLTFAPKLYFNENPLFLSVYRQAFKNSFLTVDGGYTQGYKKTDNKKTSGGRSHLFSKLNIFFTVEDDKQSDLEINLQKVSNDTYLKVYDVNTTLVSKNQNVLENTINYTYQNNDFYFGATPSVYEDINKLGRKRHEYLLPLTIEKNLIASEKFGFLDIDTDLKVKNYDVDKQSNFFVNDFNWKSHKWLSKFGFENYLEGLIKTVNYETENTNEFKNGKKNSEINSALGYFSKLNFYKKDFINKSFETLTPKFLLRYAPGHMRKIESGKLNYGNLFNLNKINEIDVVENGLSTSVGFEYKKNKLNKNNMPGDEIFSFSAGQVISDKENIDLPSQTSLEQRFSDVVGETKVNINNNLSLNYNFSVDQGYKTINYNEIGTNFKFEKAKFNLNYLQEKEHIGNQEYVKSDINFQLNDSSEFYVSTKRNLLTSSAEFYNFSYNYINDCLKAGVAFRREFYTDRDVEPTNNLMFTISIVPFAIINSPDIPR